ncbi:MAG: ribonuclease P protein component 4 [Thermoplasmata archaeon]
MNNCNKKAEIKKISEQRINKLFNLAIEYTKKGNFGQAQKYVSSALKISSHYKVPVPEQYKHIYCKKCNSILIPSKTAQIRLKNKKIIIKCFNCGNYRRFIIK